MIFYHSRADTIFSRRLTPDTHSSYAGSDFNAIETDKALSDDPLHLHVPVRASELSPGVVGS
jgi:hypothetical protein